MSLTLKTNLAKVLRTTREYIEILESMGIRTVEDLLLYLPRTHEDLTQMQTIRSSPLDQKVTIRGSVSELKLVRIRGGKKLVKGFFIDTDGEKIDVVWFNQPHILRMLGEESDVVLAGKLKIMGRKLQFQSPMIEKDAGRPLVHAGRLVPIYPQHERINTRWLREKMILIKEAIELLPETLPEKVIEAEGMLSRADTIRALHFPEEPSHVEKARARMAFERMYQMQMEAMERRKERQGSVQERLKTPMDVELVRALFASLKFTPTKSQKIAIYEILKDMEQDVPMSRLLEGDVGSGKTLVALTVMANVIRHEAQCALMVPTEVLSRQHAVSISKHLINFHSYLHEKNQESGIRNQDFIPFPLPSIELLTGTTPRTEAEDIKMRVASGTVDILIGTHALIEEAVRFKDLRLVIVDEQHRFGVMQRQRLRDKGSPHFLSMTATPIPRTLALTAYGDHDLSVLLEKPGQRKPIDTRVVAPRDRKTVELFIDHQIGEGRQVFVICPLITESEQLDEVKSVMNEARRLREGFPHRTVALLHGKLAPQEKQSIMGDFYARKSDILVSTSVIEVGIDVPNATIILIEGAERFGLAQLHQLRGRVGRSDHKSYCFLFTTTETQADSPRLRAMEQYNSGFQLAEIDLKLRGPGEIFGLRQSGLSDIELQGFFSPDLISRARKAAEKAVFG